MKCPECPKHIVAVDNLSEDFCEALNLLSVAGPNRLVIDESEYWERFQKLRDKYSDSEEE